MAIKRINFITLISFCPSNKLWKVNMGKIIIMVLLLTVIAFGETAEEYLKKGMEYANKGKYDEAISEMKKGIDLDPLDAEVHLNLGVVYANKKDYDTAIIEIEESVKLKSDDVLAHYVLAMLFEKKKDYGRAGEEWKKVLKLNPLEEMKNLAEKHIKRLGREKS